MTNVKVFTQNVGSTDELNVVSPIEFYGNDPKLKLASDYMFSFMKDRFSNLIDFYDSASIVEREFKAERGSIMYTTEFLDFIYSDNFCEENYLKHALEHVNNLLIKPNLEKRLMTIGRFLSKEELFNSITNLLLFDYFVAKSLKQYYTTEEIINMHTESSQLAKHKLNTILVLTNTSNCDSLILCLQELTLGVIEWLRERVDKKYVVKSNKTNTVAIIHSVDFNTSIIEFPPDDTKLSDEILVLRDETKNLYIISAHFSSKKKSDVKPGVLKNYNDQLTSYNSFLEMLKKDIKVKIISGCDYNCHTCLFEDVGEIVPYQYQFPDDTPTCKKQRTALQTQFKKINKEDNGSKDRVNTYGCKIMSGVVRTIFNNDPNSLPNLPAGFEHPFDHYLIECDISLD